MRLFVFLNFLFFRFFLPPRKLLISLAVSSFGPIPDCVILTIKCNGNEVGVPTSGLKVIRSAIPIVGSAGDLVVKVPRTPTFGAFT